MSNPLGNTKAKSLDARVARSSATDPAEAVAQLIEQLGPEPASAVTFFASPMYDFPMLAELLHEAIDAPSIGCTTAGEVCADGGHCEDSVVATAIRSPAFRLDPVLIKDAARFSAERSADEIGSRLDPADPCSFALLLIDGLSMAEEQVCAVLSNQLGEIPLAGGSAGDNLQFGQTFVAVNGRTESNAAALGLVRTTHEFTPFHSHHFEATDERLVITGAVPAERRVTEVNGEPAAEGYARAVGLTIDELSPTVFAEHPVMLSIGGEYYVRSIQKVNPDGSLTFFCAIDEGLVLRVARGRDLPDRLAAETERLQEEIDDVGLVIAFDCILRRLELLNRGQRDRVHSVLRGMPVIGFSTYGEQYNGLHVNQTMTGFAIGNAA